MNIPGRKYILLNIVLIISLFLIGGCTPEHRFVKKTAFKDTNKIVIDFAGPVDEAWAKNRSSYTVCEKPDPDIRLKIIDVSLSADKKKATLIFADDLNKNQPHVVTATKISSEGKSLGTAILNVKKFYLGYLFSILIGAVPR